MNKSLETLIILMLISLISFGQNNEINKSSNSIKMIAPYKFNNNWVFDDTIVHLYQEPFIEGVPEIIDSLVSDIPNAENGFRLYFSDLPFPNSKLELTWIREEDRGNWYLADKYNIEGWLCPALFKYFNQAPKTLYVNALSLE